MHNEPTQRRTLIVTGANAGIGREIARQLAQQGHHVVAISRDEAKGRAAVDDIRAGIPDASVDVVQGDLSSIASTHDLASRLLDRYENIHVLTNNAGVWMTRRELNADGLEKTFMVNHLAPFILSLRLLDRLKASAPARIVNVNSGLYIGGQCDLGRLPTGENFNRFKTYMHSKLCNMLFTTELAKRLDGGVTVYALHPGVIRTGLGDARGIVGALLKVAKRFWGTPEDGAKPVVRLATDPGVAAVAPSGAYFDQFKEIPLAPVAQDPEKAQALWVLSAKLTGCG